MKNQSFARAVDLYVFSTMGIGGMCKVVDTWNAKVERWVGTEQKATSMLLGEKIGLFVWGMFTGPALFPFKVTGYIDRLDIWMKGEEPEMYGFGPKKKYITDYLY